MLNFENNKYFEKYCTLVPFEFDTVDEALVKHNSYTFELHLKLNQILYGFTKNLVDRRKIEADRYFVFYQCADPKFTEYLQFPAFRSNESREHYRQAQFNQSDETKKKRAEARRGKKHTEKSKALMSSKAKGRIPYNKGKQMSVETKEKLRIANLGKKQTEETRQKRSKTIAKLKWFNNGNINIRAEFCPEGFTAGRFKK